MNFIKKDIFKNKDSNNNKSIKTEDNKETIFSFTNVFLSFLFVIPLIFMLLFPNRLTIMIFVFLSVLNINIFYFLKK